MEPVEDSSRITSQRHKCAACYKQFKKKEHLIAHMQVSYHSVHQPKCGVCQKHCRSFESLREHVSGPLAKSNCWRIFSAHGCDICLEVFNSPCSLNEHKEVCCLSAPAPLGPLIMGSGEYQFMPDLDNGTSSMGRPSAIAMDCEMVGGGTSLNLCARVCLVDESENIVFHTYVQPEVPVTDYRYEVTGLTEDHLKDAMPLKEVREKILKILYNGESIGGDSRLLVGHSLEYDLDSLRLSYPAHLMRDTARYEPLLKTNSMSHSLKYLTKKYLGCDIQSGLHDPFEDSVSAMRLYKRMRAQEHEGGTRGNLLPDGTGSPIVHLDHASIDELEMMSPEELYEISESDYRCWCLDLRHEP